MQMFNDATLDNQLYKFAISIYKIELNIYKLV